jgi:hypothetical protein
VRAQVLTMGDAASRLANVNGGPCAGGTVITPVGGTIESAGERAGTGRADDRRICTAHVGAALFHDMARGTRLRYGLGFGTDRWQPWYRSLISCPIPVRVSG